MSACLESDTHLKLCSLSAKEQLSNLAVVISRIMPFSLSLHKQKATQRYQLYMQEVNERIYYAQNDHE